MDPSTLIGLGTAFMAVLMTFLWFDELIRNDASVVDVGWALGVGFLALGYAAGGDGDPLRRLLPAIVAACWSFRLGLYLLLDRVIGKQEDGRYQNLRARFGKRAHLLFFLVFQAQTVLAVLFSLPILAAMLVPEGTLRAVDIAGVVVAVVSIGGEMLADFQLARFRSDPSSRGRVCREGLWGVSRHPNYFFEWLHWWSYPLLAWGSPWWWVTLLGPVLMLLFLVFVTGIAATERHLLQSRGEAYRIYQKEVSAFVPWFPRKERA